MNFAYNVTKKIFLVYIYSINTPHMQIKMTNPKVFSTELPLERVYYKRVEITHQKDINLYTLNLMQVCLINY